MALRPMALASASRLKTSASMSRGKFDLMFVADAVATRDGKLEALSRWPQYMAYFDPLTLLPALAVVTTHIGLCATATTSDNEPYLKWRVRT